MKSGSIKSGFTLIEMVLVVSIIAILVLMVVGVTKRMDDQAKERLCKNTIALVGNALEQFRDFGYEYKDGYTGLGLVFPLDCNGFTNTSFTKTIQLALGLSSQPIITPDDPCQTENSGSEGLYFFLSQVPDCRTTLDKIDKSLLAIPYSTNGDPIHISIIISGFSTPYPLTRIIDPWGTTLRYDYYDEVAYPSYPDPTTKKTFPVITSAGPDKKFDTSDDITNIQQK
jgi:prepilin-type N-terminal cleavage/methylation domain-containing protein